MFTNNIEFMDHMKRHIADDDSGDDKNTELCRYCLKMFATKSLLDEHVSSLHPSQTRDVRGSLKCIICRVRIRFLSPHFKNLKEK